MIVNVDFGNTKSGMLLLMATRNPVNSPVEVGSLSHYLQGFHTCWLLLGGFLDFFHQQ